MIVRKSAARYLKISVLRAYTLVELSVAVIVGVLIGAAIISLLNFQLQWTRVFAAQNFMIQEVPQINNLVNRLMQQSSSFKIYTDLGTMSASPNVGENSGSAVLLRFTSADGVANDAYGVLAFTGTNAGDDVTLSFYSIGNNPVTGIAALNPASPSWSISGGRNISDASSFNLRSGLLQLDLLGRNGEAITFTTTTQ